MNLLTAENISRSFTEKVLFEGVSLGISDTDRIGLIGNGHRDGSAAVLHVFGRIEASAQKDIEAAAHRRSILEAELHAVGSGRERLQGGLVAALADDQGSALGRIGGVSSREAEIQ